MYFNRRHKDKQEYYANKVILSQSDFGFEVNHLESEPGKCFCLFKPSCYANCYCCSLSVCHLKHNPIIAHTLCSSSAVQSDMLSLSRRGKHQIVFYDNMSFIHLSHLQRFISLSLSLQKLNQIPVMLIPNFIIWKPTPALARGIKTKQRRDPADAIREAKHPTLCDTKCPWKPSGKWLRFVVRSGPFVRPLTERVVS